MDRSDAAVDYHHIEHQDDHAFIEQLKLVEYVVCVGIGVLNI